MNKNMYSCWKKIKRGKDREIENLYYNNCVFAFKLGANLI